MPIDTKRTMLKQRMRLNVNLNKQSKCKTPQDYVKFAEEHADMINSNELHDVIKSLRVELTCKEVSWVSEFGAKNGHILLFKILDNISKTTLKAKINDDKKFSLLFNVIMCINSFMNNQV